MHANASLQEGREELMQQQEELQQTNEELHQQTENLRASEEELRVQEEELRQINAELEERTEAVDFARRALSQKAEELEMSSRYKSEFLANMSHELRTPLNSVLILASLLRENKSNNLTEKQIEYAKIIHKSGSDLLTLINDILDLSKIEAGKVEFNIAEIAIADIAEDMDQLFGEVARQKKIAFSIDRTRLVTHIHTDKDKVGQVIKNLLSNSFKFTPKGGKIELSFEQVGDYLSIAVKDNGIGIAPEKQQLIFEAFQQADGATTRKYGGTGLGLSISKELVRRLNGEIRVQSTTGQGSTFTLLLPLKDEATPLPQAERPVAEEVTVQMETAETVDMEDDRKEIKHGDASILIIEDDASFAEIVRDFAREKGYKAIVALRGDDGLRYAKEFLPSAIILDLNLPVMDGRSILKILKSEKTLQHIPVHVISAEDHPNLPVGVIEGFFPETFRYQ